MNIRDTKLPKHHLPHLGHHHHTEEPSSEALDSPELRQHSTIHSETRYRKSPFPLIAASGQRHLYMFCSVMPGLAAPVCARKRLSFAPRTRGVLLFFSFLSRGSRRYERCRIYNGDPTTLQTSNAEFNEGECYGKGVGWSSPADNRISFSPTEKRTDTE
ncbi:hypothetical protein VTK26DRAFT_8493 [Humicola hyalothermophila]